MYVSSSARPRPDETATGHCYGTNLLLGEHDGTGGGAKQRGECEHQESRSFSECRGGVVSVSQVQRSKEGRCRRFRRKSEGRFSVLLRFLQSDARDLGSTTSRCSACRGRHSAAGSNPGALHASPRPVNPLRTPHPSLIDTRTPPADHTLSGYVYLTTRDTPQSCHLSP